MFTEPLIREFQLLKTPFFHYDLELLGRTIDAVRRHGLSRGYHVHYAMKANNNDRIMALMLGAGFGVDCVSGREIERAVEAGFRPQQIAFAGVGKSDEEMLTGLRLGIFTFNCESTQELEVLDGLAGQQGLRASVALRINPNVRADTHKYIMTGADENKFGISSGELPRVLEMLNGLKHIDLRGIHFHIGSQIEDLSAFRSLCGRVNEILTFFDERDITLSHVNVGGGLGVDYRDPDANPIPDFEGYFGLFERHLALRPGQELHFELGRSLVAQCGSLISRVLFIKEGRQTRFAILDAGMTELIRPALYQAEHHITVLTSEREEMNYRVVGPICETSDTFRQEISLPALERGDLVAIRSCGAYGQVMSSDFNLRDRAPACYSDSSGSLIVTSEGA